MKKAFFLALVLMLTAVLLAGCGSKNTPTMTESEMATKVAQIQTNMPTSTFSAPKVVTATPSLPTLVLTPGGAATATKPASGTLAPTLAPTQAVTATKAATTTPLPPTATVTPSTPTATLAPSATLAAGDPRGSLGNPTWRDTMANGDNWPTGEDSAGYTAIDFKDGQLKLTALKPQDGWRITFDKLTNFYLEMTVKTGTCATDDRYGFIFRVPVKENPNRGYLAAFTCDGRYSLRMWDGPNTTMSGLLGWKANAAIKSGSNQTNRMGVMVKGSKITLYANGVALGEAIEGTYKEGYFGIFAGAVKTTNFTIAVDEIAYWEQ